jgi:hypothetical protein
MARASNTKVRVTRDAVLEAEGFHQQRQAGGAAFLHSLTDELAQVVHAHARGVDHQVGGVEDGLQQPSLDGDGFLERHVVGGHRVLAARLGETPQQLVVVGEQEHDFALDAALLSSSMSGGTVSISRPRCARRHPRRRGCIALRCCAGCGK